MSKPIYDLADLIRDKNKPGHLDISKAIQNKRNGLLTLQIRVNAGNIVDLVEMDIFIYDEEEK